MFEIRERDWIVAEAESLAAARACVEALVKPGNLPDGGLYGKHGGLDIHSPKGEWVMNGRLNEHGEVVWKTSDLTRAHERTVIGVQIVQMGATVSDLVNHAALAAYGALSRRR